MPVPVQTPIASAVANGATTVFPYAYTVLQTADVTVTGELAGVVTTYSFGVHYTLSGVGTDAGSVNFLVAPAAGTIVTSYRDSELARETDYQDGGDLQAETLDLDLNRLWLALQEIFSGGKGVPNALRVPSPETLPPLPAAALRDGYLLGFSGSSWALVPGQSGSATSLGLDLASAISAVKGPALMGFNPTLNYVAGTIGRHAAMDRWNPCDYPWLCPTNGTSDCTAAINACAVAAAAAGAGIRIPAGTFKANIALLSLFDIEGAGMNKTIITPFNSGLPAIKNMANPGGANFWRRSRLAQLSLRQTGNVGNGFTFGDPALYTTGDEQIGRVDFDQIEITGFNKAVFKTCGNIGNTYRNCRVQNNNYSYYAQSSDFASGAAPAMHAGLDLFDGGAWGYATLANVFIRDRIAGKGGWTFTNDVDLEGSSGYNIVYLASTTGFGYVPDLIVDTSWLESNATGGSITIDGLTGTITGLPYDFYLSGARHVVVKGGFVGKVNLLNGTNMVAEKCGTDTVSAGVFSLTKDASSTFIWDGAASVTGLPGQLNVGPWSYIDRSTISETPVYNVPGFNKFEVAKDVTVLAGYSFGAVKYPGTVVVDGMSANRCGQFAVAAGVPVDVVPSVTTVAGRYYAVSIQARLSSGTTGTITVGNLAANLTVDHSEWRQYAFVKAATAVTATVTLSAAAGTSTMRIGHVQIVEFTTADAALSYLLRGRMAINSDARSALLPLSAFTDANGGAGASFNSAVISQVIPGTAVALCEVNLRNTTLVKVQVDMMLAIDDQSTGAALTQPVGFSSVLFATTASAPTLVLGASTVTFTLVNIGGTVWELRASQTGSAAGLAISGLAFIKGH
jgi:hypothetical protein